MCAHWKLLKGLWNLRWDPGIYMSSLFPGKADAAGLGAKVENHYSQAAWLSSPNALMDRMFRCVVADLCIVGCLSGFCFIDVQSIPSPILPQL